MLARPRHYTEVMKVSQPLLTPQSPSLRGLANKSGPPEPPKESFEPSPPSTPLWKKALNSGVVSVGVGAAATAAATVVLAGAISGPDALGAPILAAMVAGPVGLVTGAIAGWRNCGGQEEPSTLRKLGNAAAWGVTGAIAGSLATIGLINATVSGPDALGGLLFLPIGAGVGALGAGAIGWKMTDG